MDEHDFDTENPELDQACDAAAQIICGMIHGGQLPSNAWAFVRPIPVLGQPTQVTIWTIIASPN